jgi:glucosamine--fructose-6-phosphate aminotransferase (isomerizing)
MKIENRNNLGKYTLKEIYDTPKSLKETLKQPVVIKEIAKKISKTQINRIFLTGSGSSYHSGFAAQYFFNNLAKIYSSAEFAPEFSYLIESIINKDDLIIGLSQSGESTETIKSIEFGNKQGIRTVAISNNIDSKLAKIASHFIPTRCEKEISIIATKTYIAELGVLTALSLEVAKNLNRISNTLYTTYWNELFSISDKIEKLIPQAHKEVKLLISKYELSDRCFVLGAGPDFATAKEGALKLKEGAQIFADEFPTAEFPHGPITLASSKVWILTIIPSENGTRKEHMIKLIKKMKKRKPTIIGISSGTYSQEVDFQIKIPPTLPDLYSFLSIIPIQLLTLEISRKKGLNCDKPEFLSKVSKI